MCSLFSLIFDFLDRQAGRRVRGRREFSHIPAMVQALEQRALLSANVITVDTNADTHQQFHTTLREAIAKANQDADPDTIVFDKDLAGQTLTLTQGELRITSSMTIKGLGADKLTIDGNNASRLFAVDDGDGNKSQDVTIADLRLQRGNSAGGGGAIYNIENLTVSNDTILGNKSSSDGGGIYNLGRLTLSNDLIAGNTANNYGGGVYNWTSAAIISSGNTISGNTATNFGGGMINFGALTSTNDTFAGNKAVNYGGGGLSNSGSLTLTNDTIAGNQAKSGAGIANYAGPLNAINTLVVGNTNAGAAADFQGEITRGNNNLIGVPTGKVLSQILAIDAGGGPLLADNGGPTPTIALVKHSVAIQGACSLATLSTAVTVTGTTLRVSDPTFLAVGNYLRIDHEIVLVTANNGTSVTVARAQGGTAATFHAEDANVFLAFDQRGQVRAPNDIGAYELARSTWVVNTNADLPQNGRLTLREAIVQANLNGTGDLITFDDSLTWETIRLSLGELKIEAPMTIQGSDPGTLIQFGRTLLTIDANQASRIFNINAQSSLGGTGQHVTITGLTLQNGLVTANSPSGANGGAIYNTENLTLAKDVIIGNTAHGDTSNSNQYIFDQGGGIYNAGALHSSNSRVSFNSADVNAGGGVYNIGTYTSRNDTINANAAGLTGGGIYNSGTFTSQNDALAGNQANFGGGIYNTVAANYASTNDTLAFNGARFYGGGVCNLGKMTLTNDTIAGNSTPNPANGGGLRNNGTLFAMNTLIIGNTATSDGAPNDFTGDAIAKGGNNMISLPPGKRLYQVLQTYDSSGLTNGANLLQTDLSGTIPLVYGSPAINAATAISTLLAGSTPGESSLFVNDPTFFSVGEFLKIDSEIMQVTNISGLSLTVARGRNGTVASAHAANSQVFLGLDQRGERRYTNDQGAYAPYSSSGPGVTPFFSKYAPTLTLMLDDGIFDGSAFAATGASVIGIDGDTLASLGDPSLSFDYFEGELTAAELTGATPMLGPPKNAGTYTVVARFTSNLDLYTDAVSDPVWFTINQASPILGVTVNDRTYNGQPFAAAADIAGVIQGVDDTPSGALEGVGPTFMYYAGSLTADQLAAATPLPGAPTAAGTYTVNVTFAGSANYSGASVLKSFTISKATPTVSLASGPTVIVGSGAMLTASATLAGGVNATGTLTFTLKDAANKVVNTQSVAVAGNGAYAATSGFAPTAAGTYQWSVQYSGDGNHQATSGASSAAAVDVGVTAVGKTLFVVGANTADTINVKASGSSTTGGTGVQVTGKLNGKTIANPAFTQAFDAINIAGFGGNDTITVATALTIPVVITQGAGNNTITVGNANANVIVGNGTNKITLGNGNNVVVAGSGTNTIKSGGGNNLIVGGTGSHTITVGNGCNILIDGNAILTRTGDSFAQVLADWTQKGSQAANVTDIRSRIKVTYNTKYANTLSAGSGLDWFWVTYSKVKTNRKLTDQLN